MSRDFIAISSGSAQSDATEAGCKRAATKCEFHLLRSAYDRTHKLDWYRQHGVRECWIADPGAEQLAVFVFDGSTAHARTSDRTGAVQSTALPGFTATVESLLLLS